MTSIASRISDLRAQFPALARQHQGRALIYFDGPAGTQVPNTVNEAIKKYLRERNANHGGYFVTSEESDACWPRCIAALRTSCGPTIRTASTSGPT